MALVSGSALSVVRPARARRSCGIMMSLTTTSGWCGPGHLDALGAVVGEQHGEALQLEVHLEQAQDHRIVLDDEHRGGGHRRMLRRRLLRLGSPF